MLGQADSVGTAPTPERLHLDLETRKNAVLRLENVEEHLEGVLRLLGDESVCCVDAMKQLSAVQGALTKVTDIVLRSPLKTTYQLLFCAYIPTASLME